MGEKISKQRLFFAFREKHRIDLSDMSRKRKEN